MKRWLAMLSLAAFAAAGWGSDRLDSWPQFRGPGGSGVAEGQKPPVEIGPDKNLRWKAPVPSGFSSPIVAGDRIVITAFDEGKLYTIAYDRRDGKEAWRADARAQQLEPYLKTEGSPAASTPATDGQRIVSYFGSCGLIGYDLSGKELWRFEMPPASTFGDCGSGVSPILADGIVVLVRDVTRDPKILAVDAATGSLLWQKSRPQSPTSYCTPVVWETPAGKQIVAAGHARMIAYDLKTGREIYRQRLPLVGSGYSASPVAADGKIYLSNEDGDMLVVRAGPTFEHVATNPIGELLMATPALSDGVMYVRGVSSLFAIGVK